MSRGSREQIMKQHDLEPLNSPFSKVYLSPQTEQIINCAMGLKYPIDLHALKIAFSNSILLNHPRFCSLMVRDHNGIDCWKRTRVNIDDHIIVHPTHTTETRLQHECEEAINAYLADISVSTPLSKNKPLWEIHVLMGLQCVILRVHHALGDGASLMALLEACFGHDNCVKVSKVDGKKRSWKDKNVWEFVKSLWLTLVFGLKLLGRVLWVKDKLSVISGGDGVELWPRELVTCKFKLKDFKCVKKAVPFVTINDVLLGIISSGLSTYLQVKSPKDIVHGLQVTGIVVVNLRRHLGLQEMACKMRTSSSLTFWGNKMGLVLQPIYCKAGLHPVEHVRIMKAIMDQKKRSYEAHLPYKALNLLSSLGPKVTSWYTHRVLCNTTMLISNIVGPSEELVIGDNPVTFLRVNISSQPQAMTMHMVSYGGNLDVQVMVAKDIIEEPQFLAKCFQESLSEMKNYISQNDNFNLFQPLIAGEIDMKVSLF